MTTNKFRRQRQRNALVVVFSLSFVSLLAIAPPRSQSRVSDGRGSVSEALSLQAPSPSPAASPVVSPTVEGCRLLILGSASNKSPPRRQRTVPGNLYFSMARI